jgi:hypothetical protein
VNLSALADTLKPVMQMVSPLVAGAVGFIVNRHLRRQDIQFDRQEETIAETHQAVNSRYDAIVAQYDAAEAEIDALRAEVAELRAEHKVVDLLDQLRVHGCPAAGPPAAQAV